MPFSPLKSRLLGLAVSACAVGIDQWSKAAILAANQAHALPKKLLPVFNLVLVWNQGISFGLLGHLRAWGPPLLIFTLLCVTMMLTFWLMRAREWPTGLALGFIVGGAVGNIIDRARYGGVVDFLDFHWGRLHFWSFNAADSAIFVGVVILVLIGIVQPSMEKEST